MLRIGKQKEDDTPDMEARDVKAKKHGCSICQITPATNRETGTERAEHQWERGLRAHWDGWLKYSKYSCRVTLLLLWGQVR